MDHAGIGMQTDFMVINLVFKIWGDSDTWWPTGVRVDQRDVPVVFVELSTTNCQSIKYSASLVPSDICYRQISADKNTLMPRVLPRVIMSCLCMYLAGSLIKL